MGKDELKLSNKFLDKQTMSELETKFWDWLDKHEIIQGECSNLPGLKIKIVVEADFI